MGHLRMNPVVLIKWVFPVFIVVNLNSGVPGGVLDTGDRKFMVLSGLRGIVKALPASGRGILHRPF